jgi:hypothetical protein
MRFHALTNIFYMLAAVIATETYPAPYSYGFVEPEAPLINTDYTANFMQVSYDFCEQREKYELTGLNDQFL